MTSELMLIDLGDAAVETRQVEGKDVYDEIFGLGPKPLG
jgi:hypothetical protein